MPQLIDIHARYEKQIEQHSQVQANLQDNIFFCALQVHEDAQGCHIGQRNGETGLKCC